MMARVAKMKKKKKNNSEDRRKENRASKNKRDNRQHADVQRAYDEMMIYNICI